MFSFLRRTVPVPDPDPTTRQVQAFLRHGRPILAFLVAYRRVLGPVVMAITVMIVGMLT